MLKHNLPDFIVSQMAEQIFADHKTMWQVILTNMVLALRFERSTHIYTWHAHRRIMNTRKHTHAYMTANINIKLYDIVIIKYRQLRICIFIYRCVCDYNISIITHTHTHTHTHIYIYVCVCVCVCVGLVVHIAQSSQILSLLPSR